MSLLKHKKFFLSFPRINCYEPEMVWRDIGQAVIVPTYILVARSPVTRASQEGFFAPGQGPQVPPGDPGKLFPPYWDSDEKFSLTSVNAAS